MSQVQKAVRTHAAPPAPLQAPGPTHPYSRPICCRKGGREGDAVARHRVAQGAAGRDQAAERRRRHGQPRGGQRRGQHLDGANRHGRLESRPAGDGAGRRRRPAQRGHRAGGGRRPGE